MKALILAGGFAKRLGPIGENLPKAMLVVEGDAILNHLIKKLEAVKLDPFISTNKKFESFFSGYKNVLIEETMSEEQKLGTVSAINYAIKKLNIDDDLLVLCVDNYFTSDLNGFLSSYTGEPMIGVFYANHRPEMNLEQMGTVKFKGSDRFPPPTPSFFIDDFKEKAKPPLGVYAGMGVYIFPRRIFPALDEFCGDKKRDAPGFFIQHLVERGEKVKAYAFTGDWYDISHKSYLQAFSDARLLKSDERYIVCDKSLGKNLVLSITILHPMKQTTGHSHDVAEVYFFVEGDGMIAIDGKKRRVRSKDVIPIKPGEFHRVYNTSDMELIFVSAFEKYGERG